MTEKHSIRLIPDHFTGCLIAEAIGDALGTSIEFMTLDQIHRTHGESGLTGYAPVYGRTAAITDDTQMMLFTAEGLVLKQQQHARETLDAVTAAIETAHSIAPSPETVETMGEGWIAEEALGIGLYCAMAHENDMKKALLLSINHSGDSDSTGTITGNILGALHGRSAIPPHWIDDLELNDLVEETAMDLYKEFGLSADT